MNSVQRATLAEIVENINESDEALRFLKVDTEDEDLTLAIDLILRGLRDLERVLAKGEAE